MKPAAPKPAPKPRAPLSTKVASISLPADVVEAFSADSSKTPPITDADLDYFAPCVDATKRHFKTAPCSPRHLSLVRRMALVRGNDLEGDVRTYFVALIDISTFPLRRITELETFGLHVSHLVHDVLDRIKVKRSSSSMSGCCASSAAILVADEPKANALIAAHARWIDHGPPFLAPIPNQLAALTAVGLSMLESQ